VKVKKAISSRPGTTEMNKLCADFLPEFGINFNMSTPEEHYTNFDITK